MKKSKNQGGAKNGVSAEAPFNRPETTVFPGTNHVGIGNPDIALPAYNPPVPNRAWTEMRAGRDIDDLSYEEIEDMRFD